MANQNLNVQKVVTVVAIFLFIIKFAAWYITHSLAILTDAFESTINVVTGFIGLYSIYLSSQPKDSNHPYGHGKVEFISAAIEGTLILVAGLLIVYQSIHHFFSPVAVTQLDLGILLIGFSGLINFLIGRYAISIGKKNNSLALIASGKHLLSDMYSTLGIIVGLIILHITHYKWIDLVTALLFSIIIIYTGYRILRKSLAGIMDEADTELLEKMVKLLNAERADNWIDLHNLRIIKYGSLLHLDCHLTVPWYYNVHEAHEQIDELEQLVKNHFGTSIELFVHTDACANFSCKLCNIKNCKVRVSPFQNKMEWTIKNISTNSKHRLA